MANGIRPKYSKASTPGHPDASALWNGALITVTVIALLAALYVARSVVLPVLLSLLFSFLLSPIVRFLERLHIPPFVASALVIISLCLLVAVGGLLLSAPAAQWIERAPEVISRLQERLHWVLVAVRKMTEATEQVGLIAGSGREGVVQIRGPGLQGIILSMTWQFVAGTAVMLFLLYFLLGSGPTLLRKFVRVLPRMRHKKAAVIVARHIEHDVSAYLFTVAAINTVLGVVVASVMYLMGMPNPLLWGAIAGVLNFIPYLGPALTLSVLAAAAVLTFDSLHEALLRPGAFLIITSLEGQLITPLILGRRLMLNPIVIFVSLIFWGWMWGIIGALVAVPLTMIIKILCEAIPSLRPVGELLSR